jgi:hypothetical protein
MNTTCVDAHDPPVRTIEEFDREHAIFVAASVRAWNDAGKVTHRVNRTPSAVELDRLMLACFGDRNRVAERLGVSRNTLSGWLCDRGLSDAWRGKHRVFSNRGEWWESMARAAEWLDMRPSGICMAVYKNQRIHNGKRRLAYQPFPNVKYPPLPQSRIECAA